MTKYKPILDMGGLSVTAENDWFFYEEQPYVRNQQRIETSILIIWNPKDFPWEYTQLIILDNYHNKKNCCFIVNINEENNQNVYCKFFNYLDEHNTELPKPQVEVYMLCVDTEFSQELLLTLKHKNIAPEWHLIADCKFKESQSVYTGITPDTLLKDLPSADPATRHKNFWKECLGKRELQKFIQYLIVFFKIPEEYNNEKKELLLTLLLQYKTNTEAHKTQHKADLLICITAIYIYITIKNRQDDEDFLFFVNRLNNLCDTIALDEFRAAHEIVFDFLGGEPNTEQVQLLLDYADFHFRCIKINTEYRYIDKLFAYINNKKSLNILRYFYEIRKEQISLSNLVGEKDAEIARLTADKDAEIARLTADRDAAIARNAELMLENAKLNARNAALMLENNNLKQEQKETNLIIEDIAKKLQNQIFFPKATKNPKIDDLLYYHKIFFIQYIFIIVIIVLIMGFTILYLK